jgi:uncharacterized protein YceK
MKIYKIFLLLTLVVLISGCGKNATFTKHQPFVVENTAPISDDVCKYMTKGGGLFTAPAVIYAPVGMFEVGDTIYLSKRAPN